MDEYLSEETNDRFQWFIATLGQFHSDREVRMAAIALNWRLIEFQKRKANDGKSQDVDPPYRPQSS